MCSSRLLLLAALALLTVLAAACTTSSRADVPFEDRTAVPAEPSEIAATVDAPEQVPVPEVVELGEDLRVESMAQPADGAIFELEIREGDGSFLLVVEAPAPDLLVGVRKVTDPTGDIRYLADLRQEVLLIDDVHPRLLADAGAIGLYVASTPLEPLPVGIWEIQLAANDGVARAEALVRRAPGDAPQQLDLAVWVTDPDIEPSTLEQTWRGPIDQVLGPHGITAGAIDVTAATGEDLRRFATIGVEGLASEFHAACAAAGAAAGSTTDRRVVVIVAETISDALLTAYAGHADPSHAAVFRPDGTLEGFAVSAPGTPVLGPDSHACVAVAADTSGGSIHPVLHEILHVAGLAWHTTERGGRSFDPFDDTPRCELATADRDLDLQVSADECPDASNLMFWTGDGLELSAEQAWHVRQHPLLRAS